MLLLSLVIAHDVSNIRHSIALIYLPVAYTVIVVVTVSHLLVFVCSYIRQHRRLTYAHYTLMYNKHLRGLFKRHCNNLCIHSFTILQCLTVMMCQQFMS